MAGVNLLQSAIADPVRTRAARARRPSDLATAAITVAVACALGSWWWLLHREVTRLERELTAARASAARLRPRVAEADVLARTAAALERRIEAIEVVRRRRGDRLRALTAVAGALPDGCWLSTLADDGSGAIRIEGRALDVSSMFEFVQGIAESGVFGGGVDVLDSRADGEAGVEGDGVVFLLRASLHPIPAPQRPIRRGAPQGAAAPPA